MTFFFRKEKFFKDKKKFEPPLENLSYAPDTPEMLFGLVDNGHKI